MIKAIRKTIDFSPIMYEQIKEYGAKRGCRNFGEIIRDIVRTALNPSKKQKNKVKNTPEGQKNQEECL